MKFNQATKFVRNALVVSALTLPTVTMFNVSKASADPRDVVIHNNTDIVMKGLYVSPQNSNSWGSNRLTSRLDSGEKFQLRFNNSSTTCVYDVKAVYEDSSYDRSVENLCQESMLYYYGFSGDNR